MMHMKCPIFSEKIIIKEDRMLSAAVVIEVLRVKKRTTMGNFLAFFSHLILCQVHLKPQWWEAGGIKWIWSHSGEKLGVPSASEITVVRSWWCKVLLKSQWWETGGAKCIWSHSGEKMVVQGVSDATVVRSRWCQVYWSHSGEKLVVRIASEVTVVRCWWCQVNLKPQWWEAGGANCIWSHCGEMLVVPSESKPQWWEAGGAKCIRSHSGEKLVVPNSSEAKVVRS